MKSHSALRVSGLALVACLLSPAPEAAAQTLRPEDVLRIRNLDAQMVRAPEYHATNTSPTRRQREWLEIRVDFQTRPDWIDELTFTYYVVLQNRRPEPNQPEFTLYTGQSAYVNIARTNDGRSTVYVHPSTVERFGRLYRVGVVVTSAGRTLAMESAPTGEGRWWEQLPPQQGYVLSRMETPFAMVNFNDFEMAKPPTR